MRSRARGRREPFHRLIIICFSTISINNYKITDQTWKRRQSCSFAAELHTCIRVYGGSFNNKLVALLIPLSLIWQVVGSLHGAFARKGLSGDGAFDNLVKTNKELYIGTFQKPLHSLLNINKIIALFWD